MRAWPCWPHYFHKVIGVLYRAADAIRRRFLGPDIGRVGEDLAHRYLRARGCVIVARRYRPTAGAGEIDLVAWDHDRLVFVEVKTRASAEFGAPERAVDAEKRDHLMRGGRDYARRAGTDWGLVRFDVVSVVLDKPPKIEWIRDAFGRPGAAVHLSSTASAARSAGAGSMSARATPL